MTDPTRLNEQPKSGYPGFSDTDPTPERRWRWDTGDMCFYRDDVPKWTWEVEAALNEAETLRAERHRKTTALTVAVAFAEEVRTERDEARERVRVLEAHRQFLWDLLDNIDTMSDAAKGDRERYYQYAEAQHARRWEISSSDGYTVTWKEARALAGADGDQS